MGHVDLASPVVHAWYKNSPSGGIHQLLQLSSYEIDKILSFVKYIVIKAPDEKAKDFMRTTLKGDFAAKLIELDEIYKEEDQNEKNAKRKNELKEIYEEKKRELTDEQQRLNSIISELERGKTIMEADWRSFFSKFSDQMEMASGPEGILKALKEIDVEETGKTYQENALIKALELSKQVTMPIIADDSGIEIEALNNEPGIYSSRFSQKMGGYEKAMNYIISQTKEKNNNKAKFVCDIVLVNVENKPLTFEGVVNGHIADHFEGENGFGYDPIFIEDTLNVTFANLSKEEKNQYSHRALALKKLLTYLKINGFIK